MLIKVVPSRLARAIAIKPPSNPLKAAPANNSRVEKADRTDRVTGGDCEGCACGNCCGDGVVLEAVSAAITSWAD